MKDFIVTSLFQPLALLFLFAFAASAAVAASSSFQCSVLNYPKIPSVVVCFFP